MRGGAERLEIRPRQARFSTHHEPSEPIARARIEVGERSLRRLVRQIAGGRLIAFTRTGGRRGIRNALRVVAVLGEHLDAALVVLPVARRAALADAPGDTVWQIAERNWRTAIAIGISGATHTVRIRRQPVRILGGPLIDLPDRSGEVLDDL